MMIIMITMMIITTMMVTTADYNSDNTGRDDSFKILMTYGIFL